MSHLNLARSTPHITWRGERDKKVESLYTIQFTTSSVAAVTQSGGVADMNSIEEMLLAHLAAAIPASTIAMIFSSLRMHSLG